MSGTASIARRTFGRYHLQELVAVTGMGVVYRAWDPKLECTVAIKLVTEGAASDESAREQLFAEARIASSLNHPNICIIRDVEESYGQAGIVMEFVEGRVLTKIIPALAAAACHFLRVLLNLPKEVYVPPVAVAIVYAGLGRMDDAFTGCIPLSSSGTDCWST